jgi:RimJ/RimL family protein N-acetyltransferase
VTHDVTLRPYTSADIGLRGPTESEFDDFGPRGADAGRAGVPGADLDGTGGMVVCENGVAVGSVSWHHQQWGPTQGSRCLMIGISLLSHATGRGIGTRAQRALAEQIFLHTRINRVEAATEATNLAEQRSLEKAGFTREGVIRQSMWRRGRFHDSVLYSILRDEVSTDDAAGG